jgi:hypothetical protein
MKNPEVQGIRPPVTVRPAAEARVLWSTMHDRALAAARATVSVHFFPPILNALFDARDAAPLLFGKHFSVQPAPGMRGG